MSQSPSLIKNIYYGLQNYQSKQLLILLLVGPLLDSLLFYRQTQITFRRSEIISQNNQPQYLSNYYTVFGISIIQVVINLLFNNWFKKFIIQDLKKFYQQFYLEKILLQTNPFWLSTQNTQELYQSFQTGSETLVNTFIFSIDTLKSLLNIGLSFSLIWNELGSQNIIPIICIFWMICYQYYIGQKNKSRKEGIRKTNKQYQYQNDLLSQNLFVSFINGQGPQVIESILKNQHILMDNDNKVTYKHTLNKDMLFMMDKMIRLANVMYLSSSFNCAQLFTFEIIFSRIKYHISKPIELYEQLSEKSTQWSDLQEYLQKIVVENHQISKLTMEEFDINILIPNLVVPKSLEYRVIGPSGAGKSTWIKSSLCYLKLTYHENWCYLDQHMVVPQNEYQTMYEYFLFSLLNKDVIELRKKIIRYAQILGLEKIINEDKLDSPFQNPSGGEMKRICILRKFLPILIGEICPKVIFADEISSGLDNLNFLKVRDLIELIKSEYQIVFVVAEHRDYQSTTMVINLKVMIELEPEPQYQFVHPGKEIPWYSESIFSSLAKTKPSKDQQLKTNPPKVSIQRFQIIHAVHSFRCSLM